MRKNMIHVNAALDYIEKHLSQPLDLDHVANAMHYSKFHLHRLFHEMTGVTMHDYIKRRRLSEVAKLLVFSKKSILEIALMAGYESQQAFSVIFKTMYKKTPLQFRQDEQYYPLQLRYPLYEIEKKKEPIDWYKRIELSSMSDIDLWMKLIHLICDGFPNLKEDEYETNVLSHIVNQQAWMMKHKGNIIAGMIINKKNAQIEFLGIHPQFRSLDIPSAFLRKAMEERLPSQMLSTTTFREGDKADPGYRRMLKHLGFAQQELLIEFGYPTQRMVLFDEVEQDESND